MDSDIIALIKSLGFNDKESKIYLALLELGQSNVSLISNTAGIKRPTAYLILEELTKLGYVTEVLEKNKKVYQAVDPSIILIKKRTELKNFAEMIPLLETMQNKNTDKPQISYFATKAGIWNIYESLNFVKEAFYISSYQKINEHFPGKVDEWIRGYQKKHYKVNAKHLISNHAGEIEFGKKFKDAGQQIRVLPKEFDTDLVLTENKIAISSLGENPFLILIESSSLAKSLKPLLEIIWQASKEI